MLNSLIKKINFKRYEHVKYILLIPIYMTMFIIEEQFITTQYYVSYMPLDDQIPFSEWFVIPYVIWYPLMVGTGLYLFFKDPGEFKNYMLYVGVGYLLIVVFYAFFPNGQNLRPTTFERSNILVDAVKLIYSRDTNTNVCPSLHVVGTMGAMFALLKCKRLRKMWFKIFIVLLSIAVCASTVYIKQHSILDVFTGVPLGIVYYFAVYSWYPKLKARRRTRRKEEVHIGN